MCQMWAEGQVCQGGVGDDAEWLPDGHKDWTPAFCLSPLNKSTALSRPCGPSAATQSLDVEAGSQPVASEMFTSDIRLSDGLSNPV